MPSSPAERIQELEAANKALTEQQHQANFELRRLGIENGSKGVKGGFFLIGFIFLVNAAYAYATGGKQLFEAMHLIGLGIVVCVALVAYFGFIFRFTVNAKFAKDGIAVATTEQHNSKSRSGV